jgi:hypothetical protein
VRGDALYWPTHGPSIVDPKRHVGAFIAHRREREAAILARLKSGDTAIPDIVRAVYAGLDPRLVNAAGRSVLAHLIALMRAGKVTAAGTPGVTAQYRLSAR